MADTQPGRDCLKPHDELSDLLRYRHYDPDLTCWDDLVERLAVYDVTYLAGGSAAHGRSSPYRGPQDVALPQLIMDLANAPEARLREALIALLLRHPESASTVHALRDALASAHRARSILGVRLLAAAALQRLYWHELASLLRGYQPIDVGNLLTGTDLPPIARESGRALLQAAAQLFSGAYPIDWIDGWEDVAHHVLQELRWTATSVGTP